MSLNELRGIRWASEKIIRTTLQVPLDDGNTGAITFRHPKMRVIPKVQSNGEAVFEVKVTANGTVRESFNASIDVLEKKAAQAIEKEIRETYLAGLAKHCDPFRLEETLYRKYPGVFHKLTKGGFFFLNERSLGSLQVKVHIISTGKYKETVK